MPAAAAAAETSENGTRTAWMLGLGVLTFLLIEPVIIEPVIIEPVTRVDHCAAVPAVVAATRVVCPEAQTVLYQ
jgi:hypothetical protein